MDGSVREKGDRKDARGGANRLGLHRSLCGFAADRARRPPFRAFDCSGTPSVARRGAPVSPYLVRWCIIGVSFLGGKDWGVFSRWKGRPWGCCNTPTGRRGRDCGSPRASLCASPCSKTAVIFSFPSGQYWNAKNRFAGWGRYGTMEGNFRCIEVLWTVCVSSFRRR